MHFRSDLRFGSINIRPPEWYRRPPTLIERLKRNWLFAACLGALGLVVLCGLW
jgi:hypothetical protein